MYNIGSAASSLVFLFGNAMCNTVTWECCYTLVGVGEEAAIFVSGTDIFRNPEWLLLLVNGLEMAFFIKRKNRKSFMLNLLKTTETKLKPSNDLESSKHKRYNGIKYREPEFVPSLKIRVGCTAWQKT